MGLDTLTGTRLYIALEATSRSSDVDVTWSKNTDPTTEA
jgi:hypothetical protein